MASRPMSLITMWSAQRATMPMPPKQPLAPPISTMTGMPAARTSSSARITSDTAISPALASCSRTPPDSASSSTAVGPVAQRALQQPDQLGAMHLADAAAHERALLRGDEDGAAIERRAADRHAVVEGRGHAELRQVRAGQALGRRQPFVKAAGIEQHAPAARVPSIRRS